MELVGPQAASRTYLEVNPRFPGAMVLTVGSAIDMPRLVLDAALGQPLPPGPLSFLETAVVRYWEECFLPVDELGALPSPEESAARDDELVARR